MNYKSIKTKRPFVRMTPEGYLSSFFGAADNDPDDRPAFGIVSQSDFLREYYPSGHKINDQKYYPDIYKYSIEDVLDDDGNPTGDKKKVYYCDEVPRVSFAFQRIIATKQLIHLCGNDIQFDVNTSNPTAEQEESYNEFKRGWLSHNMELAFYLLAKSVKVTGDGAIAFYINNGKCGWRDFSFLKGDKLYPHYDQYGNLESFARSYVDYDEEGNAKVEWLEVWDKKTYARYRRPLGDKTIVERIIGFFKVDGFEEVTKPTPHGFSRVPIAYKRCEDGACWSASQDTIDQYEMAYSQMSHNNKAYGEPVLVCQGEGISAMHDEVGTVKSIEISDTEGNVSYLQAQSASESFMKELDEDFRMIYKQSFIVDPPELKSGDTPAAAIKILYSPAYEKAFNDSNDFQLVLDDMVELFKWCYGLEMEKTLSFANIPMVWYIKPYIHVNESAIMTDLATGVNSGFISKKTASEAASFYTTVDEYSRLIAETKDEQESDLLYNIKLKRSTQNTTTADTNNE